MERNIEKKEMDLIDSSLKFSRWFLTIFIGITIGGYFGWFLLLEHTLSTNTSDWAAFGDYFGGLLNPVIAFFAFYFLTVSVVIQKNEMSETRKALVASSEAHKAQADTAVKSEQYTVLRMMFDKTAIELNSKIALRQSLLDSVNNHNEVIQALWGLDGNQKPWQVTLEELNVDIDKLTSYQQKLIDDSTEILTK